MAVWEDAPVSGPAWEDAPRGKTGEKAPELGIGERVQEGVKAVGQGLAKGVLEPAKLARTIESHIPERLSGVYPLNLLKAGVAAENYLGEQFPALKEGVSKAEKFANEPSKTPEAGYIKSVAEQVPGAIASPGAALYRGASAVGSGLGAEAAGDLTGNDPYGRVIGALLGGIGGSSLAGRLAPSLRQSVKLTPAQESDIRLMDQGYKLIPSQANPSTVNRLLEGLGGKYRTAQEMSVANQEITDNLARQAAGIPPDFPITKETLQTVRDKAGQSYQAIKDIQEPMRADGRFVQDVAALGDRARAINAEFPGTIDTKDIDAIQSALSRNEYSFSGVMDYIKRLREEASTLNQDYGNVRAKDSAALKKSTASLLEDFIDRNLADLQMPDLLKDFREARTLIAKTHDIEDALTPNWNVSEKGMFRTSQKKPLTGELETIAEMGGRYPKAVQEISEFGGTPTVNPLELAIAGAGAKPQNALELPIVGQLVRSLQRSTPYQKSMVRPRSSEIVPDEGLLVRSGLNPEIMNLLNSTPTENRSNR